jgi:hypothetical protein
VAPQEIKLQQRMKFNKASTAKLHTDSRKFITLLFHYFNNGHAVAQLVKAPRYKPEGRGFDSRWCHWNFSLT